MIIETFEHCQKEKGCQQNACKYFTGCYAEVTDYELIETIKELYKKVKVNPDWGN